MDRPLGARLRGGEDGSSLGDNSDRRRLRSVGVVATVGGLGTGSGWWTGLLLLMPLRQQKLAMEFSVGRSSPGGSDPSDRMAAIRVLSER